MANCAALLADGNIAFEQRKMLLPTYDVFDEIALFPARAFAIHLSLRRRAARHHHLRGYSGTTRISGPSRSTTAIPWPNWSEKGTTVIVNISASPYTLDKRGLRFDMLDAIARRIGCPLFTSIRSAATTA